MSSDKINCNEDQTEEETPSTSRRGRNLSESSDPGTKRQRTLSESFFPGLTSASPPKFVSLEEIISAANGMANMALAHEIAVDSTFQLEKRDPPENSLHKQVKETMVKIFWDILKQELQEEPPSYSQALVLLTDVKEMLLSLLLPHHSKLKEGIDEVLDTELIQQQVDNGTLDFAYYANYVISVMAKLCSPARDENINKLKQETDTVAVFKGILETLDLMRLDMANFTIGMYRPLVVASSVDYEKSKFKEFLKVNPEGLGATKAWLLRHVTPSTPLGTANHRRDLVSLAYLELLTWNDENPFPETLAMDHTRLDDLRKEVLRLSVAAAVLLIVVSTVPQLQSRADFKVLLKDHVLLLLEDLHSQKDESLVLPHVSIQVIYDCNSTLAQHLSEETKDTLEAQVGQVLSADHRIRQLVFQRIKEFLHSTITTATPSQLQVPPGLSSFSKELSALAARFHRLFSHNRNVFGEYYTEILESAHQAVPNGV